jgi:hypothetical protein
LAILAALENVFGQLFKAILDVGELNHRTPPTTTLTSSTPCLPTGLGAIRVVRVTEPGSINRYPSTSAARLGYRAAFAQ